jgi:hypothetical protein
MVTEYLSLSSEALHESSIDHLLNTFEIYVGELEKRVAANPDDKRLFPEGHGYKRVIEARLKGEKDIDSSAISRYFELYRREDDLKDHLFGQDALSSFVNDLGADAVGHAFAVEPSDGIFHDSVINTLKEAAVAYGGYSGDALAVLKNAYKLDTITALLGTRGSAYEEELHTLLLEERILEKIAHTDLRKLPYDAEHREYQAAYREWMSDALEVATGITHEEAMNYAFSASRGADVSGLVRSVRQFDTLGIERIRRITDFTGIYGVEAYTTEQLERMDALASNLEIMAEKLKDRDVNVVMINRFGDNSTVMRSVAAEFDDETDSRTLFFEITHATDILKVIARLAGGGIRPSTLVLSAHGDRGRFTISDERNAGLPRTDVVTIASRKLIALADSEARARGEAVKGFSMHGMRGVARAMEQYMQPSRGIDDDASTIGRKKIIFQSCYTAAETGQKDVDDKGKRVMTGIESIASQLAKDLSASGVISSIDIYGAEEPIQMARTKQGVQYTGHPIDWEHGRTFVPAIRVRLENGRITKESVDEILLRKPVDRVARV